MHKAILLAAGRGSRLNELTEKQPKCLTALGGQSLLEWQLKALKEASVSEVGIVTGYLKEVLEAKPFCASLKFFHNPIWSETHMVSSWLCAAEWLKDSISIMSYTDIVYPASTIQTLLEAPGDIVLPYSLNWLELWQERFSDPLSDAETFRIDEKGNLTEIGKKPSNLSQIQGQYMGLAKFTSKGFNQALHFLEGLPTKELQTLDFTSFLNRLCQLTTISTIPLKDMWLEVDNKNDLELYQKRFMAN